ncbi:hypothetical protein lacNasYZ03_11330 [Lactobacillus nasalidis]|uniref:Uncharacterized protein n=2 Tax=Lactobacillus nasalidis TaxID=2797258 RepID=A0ABQ3W7D1_9LACO|nr:hypothetical protein [Lactobacillus nasalidis]GHV97856.1 hypothetical protein lacNasYZ01_10380 [Lactobacillus nasalidis]GHW00086.1 hypothetical protein lacNasYZ02_15150 [Lactobacillus nasalidis]GHW01446.1 hypothetical protein lacNasYZ03_11330 [Lactobacillus nasalidis]
MEQIENHMIVEARQKFIMEQAAELMDVDNPDEEAQREYLIDEIDRTTVVGVLLESTGLGSIEDIGDFLADATLDDLESLLHDIEDYEEHHDDF